MCSRNLLKRGDIHCGISKWRELRALTFAKYIKFAGGFISVTLSLIFAQEIKEQEEGGSQNWGGPRKCSEAEIMACLEDGNRNTGKHVWREMSENENVRNADLDIQKRLATAGLTS